MSRNVPDDLFVRVDKLLGDEPFRKLAEIIYNRGAQDALSILRNQVDFRLSMIEMSWREEGVDDPFKFGKMQGLDWARDAARHMMKTYEEEK